MRRARRLGAPFCRTRPVGYVSLSFAFVGPDALIGPLGGSFRRGASPPAGGEFLCPRRQRNQNAAGGRLRMDTSCPYSPYPRSPITGDAYLLDFAVFPARKI